MGTTVLHLASRPPDGSKYVQRAGSAGARSPRDCTSAVNRSSPSLVGCGNVSSRAAVLTSTPRLRASTDACREPWRRV